MPATIALRHYEHIVRSLGVSENVYHFCWPLLAQIAAFTTNRIGSIVVGYFSSLIGRSLPVASLKCQ